MQLLYPTKPSIVTVPFGAIRKWYKPSHKGTDFRTWGESEEIRAAMTGKVIHVTEGVKDWFTWNGKDWIENSNYGNGGSYGNHIILDHGGYYTLYAHLSKVFVEKGNEVGIGEKIALGGNTGHSMGAHLHFELRIGANDRNHCVNPMTYLFENPYNPDTPSTWARKYIDKAKEIGITNGERPHDNLTREESIVMIMRAISYLENR